MTPTEFAAGNLDVALQVSAGTGIDPGALLAQWGVETAWGNAVNNQNNLGNIRCSPTSFCQYASLDEFAAAAIATWHNGEYPGVLAAAGASVAEQLAAIGASPWSGEHYGGPPFTKLLDAYSQVGGFMDAITATLDRVDFSSYYGENPDGSPTPFAQRLFAAIKAAGGTAAVDFGPVLQAIADLKAHPTVVADPAVLAIATRIETAFKAA